MWSSFNLDFQSKLGTMRLSQKLVTNTTSSDDADLGLPVAFDFWNGEWWAICGTRIFRNGSKELTAAFTEDASVYSVGSSTSQFDVTNITGNTYRYTWDTTGTDPGITALTFPIGATVIILGTNLAAGNRGTFTVTGSGANYFEVTNPSGVAETDKTINTGTISVSGGTIGRDFSTTVSDIAVFNDKLWTTSTNKLRYKQLGATTEPWTTLATLSSSSAIHKMVYFKKFDRLYVINQSSGIYSVDSSDSVATSSDYFLNPGNSIGYLSTMVANNNYIWIGTFRDITASSSETNNLKGSILQWDGISNQVTNEFIIETGGILAMTVLNNVPYAIDTEGRILKYTGYSFEEIARLPIDKSLLLNATEFGVSRFIHQNGMVATKDNTIQILINNLKEDANSTIYENCPSGIWELDLSTRNFTHKYSPTLKAMSSSTVTDFGQNRVSAVGALKINTLQSNSVSGRSLLLAGINYFTDASTVKSAIYIDSPFKPDTDNEGQKRGYFVTTWFESNEITDNFTSLWATYKKFFNSSDKIIFKYRLEEEDPIEATITWTSTTTFTTTTNIAAYAGYEVEIIQGTGSGACANILTIVSGATYTVTIDTAITGVTGTSKARFQKWIKIGEVSYAGVSISDVLSYSHLPIAKNHTKIQIKGILEWTGNGEFHKMCVVSTDDIKITP